MHATRACTQRAGGSRLALAAKVADIYIGRWVIEVGWSGEGSVGSVVGRVGVWGRECRREIGMHTGMRIDMRGDMCIDMFRDMYMRMCAHVRVNICIDMCINLSKL